VSTIRCLAILLSFCFSAPLGLMHHASGQENSFEVESRAAATARIHVLGLFDTNDGDIGKSCEKDATTVSNFFRKNVNANRLNYVEVSGLDFTLIGLQGALNRMRSGTGGPAFTPRMDTLVIHLSSHGAFDTTGRENVFPLRDGTFLRRSEMRSLAQELNPRLLVILTDTCSELVSRRARPVASAYVEALVVPRAIRSLFLIPEGFVDISATVPPQFSFGDKVHGGFFTYSLFKTVEDSRDRYLNWNDVISSTNGIVRANFGTNQTANPVQPLPASAQIAVPVRPRFGVRVANTSRSAEVQGVEIIGVDNGSPAMKVTRLADGRQYILPANRHAITHVNTVSVPTQESFVRAVADSPALMRFTLLRLSDGRREDYQVTLRPRGGPRFGVVPVDPADDAGRRWEGVSIQEVIPQSAATQVVRRRDGKTFTLVAGQDVITQINGERVRTAQEVYNAIAASGTNLSVAAIEIATGEEETYDVNLPE